MILAGDIGGTNTRLAYFEEEPGGTLVSKHQAKYPSKEYGNLTDIIHQFVTAHSIRVEKAAIGVAGPVVDGRVRATNLPWIVDQNDVAEVVGIERVHLINDLEANPWGIDILGDDDFM